MSLHSREGKQVRRNTAGVATHKLSCEYLVFRELCRGIFECFAAVFEDFWKKLRRRKRHIQVISSLVFFCADPIVCESVFLCPRSSDVVQKLWIRGKRLFKRAVRKWKTSERSSTAKLIGDLSSNTGNLLRKKQRWETKLLEKRKKVNRKCDT